MKPLKAGNSAATGMLDPGIGLEQARQFANMTQVTTLQTFAPLAKMMQANLETWAEILAFAQRRTKAQAALWQSLAQCNSPDDSLNAQRDFVERMTDDYTVEGTNLADLAQRNMSEMATSLSVQINGRAAE